MPSKRDTAIEQRSAREDERVKIDAPFEDVMRALLNTPQSSTVETVAPQPDEDERP